MVMPVFLRPADGLKNRLVIMCVQKFLPPPTAWYKIVYIRELVVDRWAYSDSAFTKKTPAKGVMFLYISHIRLITGLMFYATKSGDFF
jgi:hypothetical protein